MSVTLTHALPLLHFFCFDKFSGCSYSWVTFVPNTMLTKQAAGETAIAYSKSTMMHQYCPVWLMQIDNMLQNSWKIRNNKHKKKTQYISITKGNYKSLYGFGKFGKGSHTYTLQQQHLEIKTIKKMKIFSLL